MILFIYKYPLHSAEYISFFNYHILWNPTVPFPSSWQKGAKGAWDYDAGLQAGRRAWAANETEASMPGSWWEWPLLPLYRVPSLTQGPQIRRPCPDSSSENPNKKITCAVDTGFAIAKTGNFCQLVFVVFFFLAYLHYENEY